MTNLEIVRRACERVNGMENAAPSEKFLKTYRLADVVYTLREKENYQDEWLIKLAGDTLCLWDMLNDDLESQHPETLSFLAHLLK